MSSASTEVHVRTKEYAAQDSIRNDENHIYDMEEDSFIVELGKESSEESDDPEYIEFKSEIKAVAGEEAQEYGRFEGYASAFDNTDLGNDVIKGGAFRKSLRKRGVKGVKLLYQHKTDMPIGVFDSIKEDAKGLYVKGRLALKTIAGSEAYELLKMGALDGMSIGFKTSPDKISYDKRSRKRIIEEVDLMEISLVTFPMNPLAKVENVKGEDVTIREWEKQFRDDAGLSRSDAKVAAKAVHEALCRKAETSEMLAGSSETDLAVAIKDLTETLRKYQ